MKKGDLVLITLFLGYGFTFGVIAVLFPGNIVWVRPLEHHHFDVQERRMQDLRPAHMTFVGPVAMLSNGVLIT
jgi:hypothetical protein